MPILHKLYCMGQSGSNLLEQSVQKVQKVFALGGKIKHTGLVEVPMGTTLREIVEEIGGGVSDGGKILKLHKQAVLPVVVFQPNF